MRKEDHGRLYDALAERVWAAVVDSAIFRATVYRMIADYLAEHASAAARREDTQTETRAD
jgi:hypothetical protein